MPVFPRTKAGQSLLAREAYNSRSFPIITPMAVVAVEDEAEFTLDVDRLARAMSQAWPYGGNLGEWIKPHAQRIADIYKEGK